MKEDKTDSKLCIFPSTKIDPIAMLQKAQEWGMTDVLIIGENKDGDVMVGGSSREIPYNVWLLEKVKLMFMNVEGEEE